AGLHGCGPRRTPLPTYPFQRRRYAPGLPGAPEQYGGTGTVLTDEDSGSGACLLPDPPQGPTEAAVADLLTDPPRRPRWVPVADRGAGKRQTRCPHRLGRCRCRRTARAHLATPERTGGAGM